MDPKDLLLIITGVFDLFLGSLILLRNNKNQVNLSFTFFSYALAGWALGVAFFRITSDLQSSFIWAKEFYIAASLTGATLLYFANVFPENNPLSIKKKLLILGPAVIQALLIALPGYLTEGVVWHSWGKEVILNKAEYLVYTIYFLPYLYSALYLLASKSKKYAGNTRRQLAFIGISIFIASLFGVTFNLFLPWLGNYQLIYLGPPFTMLIFWIVTYAIVRHHLLDFRLIFTRVVAHTLLVLLFSGVYSFVLFFVSSLLLQDLSVNQKLVIGGVVTFLIALSFQPVRKFLEKITDKALYQDSYNSDQVLSSLSHIMSTTIDLKILTTQVLNILVKDIKLTKASLVLFENNVIFDVVSLNDKLVIHQHLQKILPFLNNPNIVVFDNLAEGEVKQLMRELKIAASIVLKVKNQTVGLLLLGDKSSGGMYSEQDLKLLKILSPEMAIAIQNSTSYEQIRRFNITLKEEVDKATKDLKIANGKLEDLDRLKDDFVSVASHELRTPMTAIRSYAWMALYRSDVKLSEKMKKYLSRTLISTERLINLVNDMLNISRIESGKVEIIPKPFDIRALVDDVANEISAKAAEKNLHIVCLESNPPRVFADPDKVHQILLNLLGNALKFTPAGKNITLSFFNDGNFLETTVKDEGVGIVKEDMSRLFTKFGRLDNSYVASATSGGTGLGLFICKNLIELMKGKIWATSEGMGKGTAFTFTLPVASQEVLSHPEKYANKVSGDAKFLEPVAI